MDVGKWNRNAVFTMWPTLAYYAASLLLSSPLFGQARAAASEGSRTARSLPASRLATIRLKEGMLTVEASNSELTQILQAVSGESGMVVEGPVVDTRVFGTFGPEPPAAVLSELLDGLGYNIMMVGSSGGGAPRKLVLTSRTGGASPPASGTTPVPANGTENARPVAPGKPSDAPLGPGAIAHPPPEPSIDPQLRMQQNLQRLQQMRQKQTESTPP